MISYTIITLFHKQCRPLLVSEISNKIHPNCSSDMRKVWLFVSAAKCRLWRHRSIISPFKGDAGISNDESHIISKLRQEPIHKGSVCPFPVPVWCNFIGIVLSANKNFQTKFFPGSVSNFRLVTNAGLCSGRG